MLKYGQWGFKEYSDSLEQKIVHNNFSYFPIQHRICKQTNKPLQYMWENTQVTSTKIHLLDQEVQFVMYFWECDRYHLPQDF